MFVAAPSTRPWSVTCDAGLLPLPLIRNLSIATTKSRNVANRGNITYLSHCCFEKISAPGRGWSNTQQQHQGSRKVALWRQRSSGQKCRVHPPPQNIFVALLVYNICRWHYEPQVAAGAHLMSKDDCMRATPYRSCRFSRPCGGCTHAVLNPASLCDMVIDSTEHSEPPALPQRLRAPPRKFSPWMIRARDHEQYARSPSRRRPSLWPYACP